MGIDGGRSWLGEPRVVHGSTWRDEAMSACDWRAPPVEIWSTERLPLIDRFQLHLDARAVRELIARGVIEQMGAFLLVSISARRGGLLLRTRREVIFTALPVVSCEYISGRGNTDACWPRDWRSSWNLIRRGVAEDFRTAA